MHHLCVESASDPLDVELANCHRPSLHNPQATTDPSARMAENAFCAAWICCTPLSWSRTAELSPPRRDSPQVTTALSPWHHNAKALFVAASCGWSTRAVRHSPSSISASSKVCSKSNRTRFLAVISLRYFLPKARWAAVLTSWTVEEGRSVRSSACPFGKATFTWSIWDILRSWRLFKTSAMNFYFTLWAQAKQQYMIWGTMQPSEGKPACLSPTESLKLSHSRELCSYHTVIFGFHVELARPQHPSIHYSEMYRRYCHTITYQVFKVFLRLLKVSFSRSLTSFCGGRSYVVCPDRIAKPMAERTSYVVTMNDLAELDCENLFIHVRVVGTMLRVGFEQVPIHWGHICSPG